VKKIVILLLLLTSIMLIISCKQTVGNTQVVDTPEPEKEQGERDIEIKREYDFDLEKTMEVLQQVLPDTELSNVIYALQYARVRGATQARLIEEPHKTLILEVVCEDNRTYKLNSYIISYGGTAHFRVTAVRDMQTGEYFYPEDVGAVAPKSPSTWAEKGQRDPVEFDVKATQEVLRSVLVDNEPNNGYDKEEFGSILSDMRMLGIPGATHAALSADSWMAKRRIIEIVSEDGKNYRFDLTRIDSDRGVRYIVYSVTDLDTGEILWHNLDEVVVW